MTHTDQGHLVARVIAGGASSATGNQPHWLTGKMPRLDGLPDVAEHLNADAMAVRIVIRDEIRATGSVPYRWLRSKKNSCGDSSDHRPTLAGVEQARRGTSHLKASAPKLKHGSMAARHWMILKREIAFEQIGNGDRQRPYVRWRPPTFRNVYSPKAPQSPSSLATRIRDKRLKSLALPRGLGKLRRHK